MNSPCRSTVERRTRASLVRYAGAEAREGQKVMRASRQRETDLAAVDPPTSPPVATATILCITVGTCFFTGYTLICTYNGQ